MRSPVLFLIFNRPEETRRSFAAIRKARPPRLYVAADGPRDFKPKDAALCRETRAVIEGVDWDCDVHTLFRDKNVRGPKGIPESIDWFFAHETEGVILEDDIAPHPDFFVYCDAMLEKYRGDERMMHISGNNFQLGLKHGDASYYFSKMAHCWGWATWARAWARFQPHQEYADIQNFFNGDILKFCRPENFGSLTPLMQYCIGNLEGHWDVRWIYSVMTQGGLCIVPNVPLAHNFGYGATATHTKRFSLFNLLVPKPLGEIRHPETIEWNVYADAVGYRLYFTELAHSGEGLQREIQLRIAEGAPAEAVEYVAKLWSKMQRSAALTKRTA